MPDFEDLRKVVEELTQMVSKAQTEQRHEDALAHADHALTLLTKSAADVDEVFLDVHRARLQLDRGDCLADLGRLEDALAGYDAALALHTRDHLAKRPELDVSRARLQKRRGNCLAKLRCMGDALAAYDAAVAIYERDHLALRSELDADRAKLQMNRATCLSDLGRLEDALAGYDAAVTLHTRDPLAKCPELDGDRARLQMNRAICLRQLGRLEDALAGYDAAVALHTRDPLAKRPELDVDRARLQMNRAICLWQLGRLEDALAGYDAAVALHTRDPLAKRPELDVSRARLQMNRAICLRQLGRLEDALAGYDAAVALHTRDPLAKRPELNVSRVRLQMNRAICLRQLGRPEEALAGYDAALTLYQRDPLAKRPELDVDRARLQMNRAICLWQLGRLEDALAGYDAAVALHTRDPLAKRPELDAPRARLQMNRAICLRQLGRPEDALAGYDASLALYIRDHLAKRPELDVSRAELQMNRAFCLADLGRLEDALAGYDAAIGVLLVRRSLAAPPELATLALAIANASYILFQRPSPHDWARAQSAVLVELFDLSPSDSIPPWSTMRKNFARFHANWLRFALFGDAHGAGRDPSIIPQILSAVQGRTMVSEALEAALAEASTAPDPVRALAQKKVELRALLEELSRMQGGGGAFGAGPSGNGTRGGGFERPPATSAEEVPADPGKSVEQLALEEQIYEGKRALAKLKEEAAKVPVYAFLNAPVADMSCARLEEKLGADEALVLAFPNSVTVEEKDADGNPVSRTTRSAHVWVLRRGHKPIVVEPEDGTPDLLVLQQRFDRLCKGLEGRGTAVRRAAPIVARTNAAQKRDGVNGLELAGFPSPVRKGPAEPMDQSSDETPEGAADEIKGLTKTEMATFWSEFEAGMAAAVWRPLTESGYLDGISKVLLATAGGLHNVPLGVGLERYGPDGVSLSHVGSLAQFALGRGLYKADGDQDTADIRADGASASSPVAPRKRIRVMHHDGDAERPIPLTAVEAQICARIWETALGVEAVASDARYPWSPLEDVDVAQAACHGGVDDRDTTRTPQVALLLADRSVVSQAALQNGPMAREWLNTACVAGRGFDDLFTGDPTGLPSGALRRGSTAMAAFLPPVPDTIGLLVGVLSCLGMAEEQLTLEDATSQAKRIIAGRRTGDQKTRLITRLIAELAEDLADRVHAEWRTYHAWVDSDPTVEDSFDDFCRTFDESELGPYLPLLGRAALPAIQEAAPTDRDETRSLLTDHLDPLPDPNTPEDQADIGVALYGLTVFGDPGALSDQARRGRPVRPAQQIINDL